MRNKNDARWLKDKVTLNNTLNLKNTSSVDSGTHIKTHKLKICVGYIKCVQLQIKEMI